MRKTVNSSIRKAMYWCSPNRTYRLTKGEQCSGFAGCPRCKGEMALYSFTKSEKMFMCKDCSFMISSGSVISAGNFRESEGMKSRRGSANWRPIDQFDKGDIVTNVAAAESFIGRVTDVDGKTNKVMVLWGAGSSEVQHDPDEIMLHPHANNVRSKMASEDDDFVGDPETHGIESPRGGGFSIMQTLQEDLHEESQDLVASMTRRMRNKH